MFFSVLATADLARLILRICRYESLSQGFSLEASELMLPTMPRHSFHKPCGAPPNPQERRTCKRCCISTRTSAQAACNARWPARSRTTGLSRPAKSRIKVFDFHHTGKKVPYTCTQCDEAWCLHACPVEAITIDRLTGAKVVNDSTCVGCKVCTIACPFGTVNYVQETGKVQKCDLCGGEPACADACPTGAITYIDANWTGLDRMKQWADKLGNQPAAPEGEHHVLGWKNPSRRSHQGHGQIRAPQHGLGRRPTSARAAWRPNTWSRRWIPRSIRCRPPTS